MVWFEAVTFWHWFALGAALMILEIVAPGMFLIWLGAAAFITGGILWFLPGLSVEIQLVSFAVLSVISLLVGRSVYKARETESDQPLLNQRGAQYVGSIYVLEGALLNGHGKVRIGDTMWSVEMRAETGIDLPPMMLDGDFVKVTGVEGSTLIVEPGTDRAWRGNDEIDSI